MGYTDLEGALVRLKLVKPADLAPLHALLQDEVWFRGLNFSEAPSPKALERLVADRGLVVWEIYKGKAPARLGYFGYARHLGTAFVFNVYPNPDIAVLADCCITTAGAFFADPLEQRLVMHVNHDLHEQARPLLKKAGFVVQKPGEPAWDPKEFTTYVLARDTYLRLGDLRERLGL